MSDPVVANSGVAPTGQQVPAPADAPVLQLLGRGLIMAQLAQIGISEAAFAFLSPVAKIAALQAVATAVLSGREQSTRVTWITTKDPTAAAPSA